MTQTQEINQQSKKQKSMYALILGLALPNIISNISVPLLSMADTAIAGRLGTITALGAVGVASIVVSFTFWLWGFLRMATTGFTAQAFGRGDKRAICRQFCVGTSIALLGGLLLLLLRPYLYGLAGLLSQGAESLTPEAITYLKIAYIGAPAALLLYVYNGWFVGLQNTLVPMFTTIISNVLNIALSVFFVWKMDMGVAGIALGTVVAQYLTVLMLLIVVLRRYRHYFEAFHIRDFFSLGEVFTYIKVGKYLLIRTMMMGAVSLYFVRAGSSFGELTVSSNTLLMQLFTACSYFMDGFAFAGEALTGRFIGERAWQKLQEMLKKLFIIGFVLSPLLSLIYWLWADELFWLLSDKVEVLQHALEHSLWIILIPIVSFASFLWDGIFVGATTSKPMSLAVLSGCIAFFVIYFSLRGLMGEDALWLAFLSYLGVRSLLSYFWGKRIIARIIAH